MFTRLKQDELGLARLCARRSPVLEAEYGASVLPQMSQKDPRPGVESGWGLVQAVIRSHDRWLENSEKDVIFFNH